jgi:hypothetical protein
VKQTGFATTVHSWVAFLCLVNLQDRIEKDFFISDGDAADRMVKRLTSPQFTMQTHQSHQNVLVL